MNIHGIKTSILSKGEKLDTFISKHLGSDLKNGDVLVISSKIVSVSEGRFVAKKETEKKELVQKEADKYLGEVGYGIYLTIKHGLFIPSAGIDASNAGIEDYILYPKDPFLSAQKIWESLKLKYGLDQLGVVLADSHTTPLRRGTTGIALAYWGFRGVRDYRGQPDMYGQPLQYTFLNVADSLAVTGNFIMGEGNEQTPLVRIRDANVEFVNDTNPKEIQIPAEEDLYYPIFKHLL